jgi:hypothetical protein
MLCEVRREDAPCQWEREVTVGWNCGIKIILQKAELVLSPKRWAGCATAFTWCTSTLISFHSAPCCLLSSHAGLQTFYRLSRHSRLHKVIMPFPLLLALSCSLVFTALLSYNNFYSFIIWCLFLLGWSAAWIFLELGDLLTLMQGIQC